MKTMTCNELGGACEYEFHTETFEEIAKMSQNHGSEMYEVNDQKHIEAMKEMGKKMSDPAAIQEWMTGAKKKFDSLPSN